MVCFSPVTLFTHSIPFWERQWSNWALAVGIHPGSFEIKWWPCPSASVWASECQSSAQFTSPTSSWLSVVREETVSLFSLLPQTFPCCRAAAPCEGPGLLVLPGVCSVHGWRNTFLRAIRKLKVWLVQKWLSLEQARKEQRHCFLRDLVREADWLFLRYWWYPFCF